MNTIKIALILLILPLQARADDIPLGDINVALEVTAQPRIEVEKPQGGWYSSIKLTSDPDNYSLYQVEIPVTVKLRRQESYRVSVKQPLTLARHSGVMHTPVQEFSTAKISWGTDRANMRLLSIDPETFNIAKSTSSQTSTDYLLHISAQAPNGSDIAGHYHGQLTLLFETNS
ncbi:TPA: fimbrial protein [Yersinia enterocolitica]|nr:fimbrial protein [Yersinia enterocolitica]HDL7337024.1 fimbrial protein [Yersinia enterocolitica]HDM8092748.1 fimbrial protein [Yersinia enterocolitica]